MLRAVRALALVGLAAVLLWPRPPAPLRGVVLISIDTLRADHLGCYGYARPTSPTLDALAAGGVRFTRATAHAPNTLPSHIALLTGRLAGSFPRPDGEAPLPESARTLAEVLSAHGFATWGFVDGGYLRHDFGLGQGFDHWEDRRIGIRRLRDRVARWLDRRAYDRRRFLLFVHTYEVHAPYAPPVTHRRRFVDPDDPSRFVPSAANLTAVVEQQRTIDDADLRHIVALYDAGIRYTDEQIGLLLRDLERRGLLRDALLVITSDHGEEFMEHGSLLHWRMYFRPNLNVPLIMRIPGRPAAVVENVVGLVDVAPTILDLLGLPPLEGVAGRSLRPLLDGARPPPRAVYAEPFDPSLPERALITETYQAMQHAPGVLPRVFDLRTDPFSQRNVAGRRRRIARQLGAELTMRRTATMQAAAELEEAPASTRTISPERRRELKALGYVE